MLKLNGKLIEFKTFPNGETKMVESSIRDSVDYLLDNKLHFKYYNDGDLFRLKFVKRYLDKLRVSTSLLIYYMPYSRMDRSINGSAFTLKDVTDFINELSFYHVEVIEPHSDVTMALLNNADSLMITHDLLPKVMADMNFYMDFDTVVFPDAGAQKRYSNMDFPNTLVGIKERDTETGKIKSLDIIGKVNTGGMKALIVDDLSSYGGTFIMTAEKLREKGFKKIYLLVGHAENAMFEGDIFSSGLIDKVYTTNTICDYPQFFGTMEEIQENMKKIKIYNIEEMVE